MKRQQIVGLVAGGAVLALLAAGLVNAQSSGQPAPDKAPTPADQAPPPETGPGAPPLPAIVPPSEPLPDIKPPAPEEKKKKDKAPKAEVADAITPEQAAAPEKRIRHGSAIIQALDKITAETMRFEAVVGRPVRYKGLVFTVRSCETSAPDEAMPDSVAYLDVRAEAKTTNDDTPPRQVFRGWMFASSPGLNALSHPVYDAWLIACKA